MHLLNEPRGASIETIVSRLRSTSSTSSSPLVRVYTSQKQLMVRIITLSATLPNSEDVAQWLHAEHYSFDSSYRPVPIERVVLGYPIQNHSNPFLFEVSARSPRES